MHKGMRILLTIIVAVCLAPNVLARSVQSTDTGTIGNNDWSVTSSGDLVPNTNSQSIGTSSYYPDEICLGGTCKSSWGSVVSPMTDASGYVYPTDSGGVYRLYDAGYLSLGAGTEIDTYVLFDGNAQDFYMGLDDTADQLTIGYGNTMGTTPQIRVGAGPAVYVGEDADVDFGLIFESGAQDYYAGIDYTGGQEEDLFTIGTGSTVGASPALSIGKATGTVYVNELDGPGAVDLDIGSADVTDVTVQTDGGTLVLDGTIALTDSEVISNATDDTVRIASNDSDTALEVYSPNTSDGDATLQLTADADADAGDRMAIVHDGGTNSMLFQSDTASADTLATILTLAKTGEVTTTAAINSEVDDASNSTVTDVLNLQHFTSGTAASGIGTGLTFDLENGAGTEEEHAYIDAVSTTATDGSEDTDLVLGQMTAGTVAETLRLVADSSATTSDYLQFTANTTETDGVTDVLVLKTATGTAANNYGLGISFQPEDATGSEEVASLDIVETTAARATNDTDFVFNQNVNGTITERVRFDADDANILLSGATPNMVIGDADEEDVDITFDGNAQDFHVGLDDTADDLVIGVGSALGTNTAISVDENTDVTVDGNLTTEGSLGLGTVETFTDSDATPDVSDGSYFITNTSAVTITDFDGSGIVAGQVIAVESAGAITYDVTSSGLKGGTTDIVTADGDLTTWLYNGTDWLLISFTDMSDDLS